MKKRLQGLNSKQLSGKMAQPIVETDIVAVEADGAETKPSVQCVRPKDKLSAMPVS